MQLENNLNSETLWEIYETTFVPEQVVTTGSNYMIGNGYLGYRGTFSDSTASDYVACVVSDTYDNADGVWKELVTAPNGLFTTFDVDGQSIRWGQDLSDGYRRELNVRYGEWTASGRAPGTGVTVRERRIASYDDIHLLASRLTISAERGCTVTVRSGIDGEVWSLNGDHFSTLSPTDDGNALEIAGVTGESGYDVLVRKRTVVTDGSGATVLPGDVKASTSPTRVVQEYSVPMDAGQTLTVDSFVVIYSTNDLRNGSDPWGTSATPRPAVTEVRAAAERTLLQATELGWEQTVTRHRTIWENHWRRMDVEIAGDDAAQLFIRYNLYQNMIATPAHTDHLPIGARGLSCQAYQGAAFWDQEVFNLPVFLYTNPEIARNILIYRYKTLNGARKKARDLGYQGAFYAWISGDS
ncbi:MAG: glycoside hydrolase family 65 protein, partial [Spirochaeta sp.]|nr:glycoside hydrolase family 65 protein [Spirochaeta sp.]